MKTLALCLLLALPALAQLTRASAPPAIRKYSSPTLSVELQQGASGANTAIFLTEHADANEVIIEAFYYTDYKGQRVMLHKEATTFMQKGITVAADVPLNLDDIEFIRVREMKLLTESEFGRNK